MLSFAILVPLSYGIAPFTPLEHRQPGEVVLFERMVDRLPMPESAHSALSAWFEGRSILADRAVRATAYLLPLTVASICFVVAAATLVRKRRAVTPATTDMIFGLAVALALLGILAYPIFTSDFWLSVGWGRMIIDGHNPYYQNFTPASLRGLPIQDFGDRMTYGPLWAWLSAGMSGLAGSSTGTTFLAGKLFLAACWVGTLALVRRIGRLSGNEADAAIAVCLFGWMPMSSRYAVGEAHNDIVMVAAFTLWLYWVGRRRHLLTPVALGASALVKYVTAPFALLELLAAWRARTPLLRYLAVGLSVAALGALLFVPFFRGMDMFEPASIMRNWVFWTPANAVQDLAEQAGITLNLGHLTLGFAVLFAAGILVAGWRYLQLSTFHRFLEVTLAFWALILFVVVGHVWPWFAVWLLPAAALTWRTPAAWAALAFCFMIPILNQGWYLERDWALRPLLGMVLYVSTGVLFLVLARWIPARMREDT